MCCIMTPVLVSVRTFGVMYDHTFLNWQITRSDIWPHIKWAVSLVIAYGHFNFPQGLCGHVWVNILTLSPARGSVIRKGTSSSLLDKIFMKFPHLMQKWVVWEGAKHCVLFSKSYWLFRISVNWLFST